MSHGAVLKPLRRPWLWLGLGMVAGLATAFTPMRDVLLRLEGVQR